MSDLRTIKYRAKRLSDNQWVYGYYYKDCETGRHIIHLLKLDGIFTGYEIAPVTVGQYIDMVDRHSNEIFEGMKVKEQNKPGVWEVLWNESVAGFEFVTEDRKHTWMPNFDYVAQEWEIVE